MMSTEPECSSVNDKADVRSPSPLPAGSIGENPPVEPHMPSVLYRASPKGGLQLGDNGEATAVPATSGTLVRRTFEVGPLQTEEFPPIQALDAFLDEKLPTPPELVKGLFHQGSKVILGGGSKTYKTRLLSDLAISVASGMKWVGFETVQARVLYVNLELGRAWFQRRLISILSGKGLDRKGDWTKQLDVWNLRGHCTDGDALLDELERRTEGKGYGLIVGDPLYKLLAGRQENSAEEMNDLFNRLEEISEKAGAASVYACHFSKGNQSTKDPLDRVSGSGVFGRDPDTIITITPHQQANAYAFEAITRNLPPVRPFVIRWETPFFVRDHDLDPELLKKPKTGREKQFKPQMLRRLFVGGKTFTSAELRSFAMETIGMSKSTFYELLRQATETGLIKQTGKDSWEAPEPVFDLSRLSSSQA
jgi:hypothetical protein